MGTPLRWLGEKLAEVLTRPRHVHGSGPTYSAEQLLAVLQPGDVLLVEGNSRVSSVIQFLTQSTWSHTALYVGSYLAEAGGDPRHCFIEADMVDGVRSVGMEAFANLNSRVCRPFGLNEAECRQVCDYAIQRIGNRYDLRNVIDLARYFLPAPPVPLRFRRSLLALGSGDPTRAICSTLIAQAFQALHYPILPLVSNHSTDSPQCPGCIMEIYKIRHHSLFSPKDFDVSPYFRIIKPLEGAEFDFRKIAWQDAP